jgi:O-antigen/teichoic acid export membrane protein
VQITEKYTIVMWKRLGQIFQNSRLTFVLVRYAATAAVVIEMLLFARLLGPQAFGSYALSIQVVGFLLLVGAGSGAGYVKQHYQHQSETSDLESNYIFGSLVQYLGGGIVLLICSWFSGSYLYISSLLLLIQIPYYISEPILRVRNNFVLPAVGRASGSIATVMLTAIVLISDGKQLIPFPHLSLETGLELMILGNTLGYATYYGVIIFGRHLSFSAHKLWQACIDRHSLRNYWQQIIMPSGIYTIATIIFTAFTYIDRLFLEHNYPKSTLSVYSLAWQIAQGVLLLLTALNTISGIRIGESQSQDPISLIKVANRQLKMSAIAGAFSLFVAIVTSLALNLTWFKDYEGLTAVTLILSLGYLSSGVIGSVMMLLFFERKYTQVTALYLLMVLISLCGNIICHEYQLSYLYPIVISSVALISINLFLWMIFRKTSNSILKKSQFLAYND